MSVRVLPVALIVFAFATEATAQNRFHWRPSRIAGSLANKIEQVFGDKRPIQTSSELVEAADQSSRRAVSIDDVIKMVHSGLGESTIIRYIGDNGVRKRLDVSDLLRLHDEGVNEPIINAMQAAKVFDSERHSQSRLRDNNGRASKSASKSYNRSREMVNVEKYGPSILAPPENDPLEPTPLRTGPAE